MSDVNVLISDVDHGMDCFEDIGIKASDFAKFVKFDLAELGGEINQKISRFSIELDELYQALEEADDDDCSEIEERIAQLKKKLMILNQLKAKQSFLEESFIEDSTHLIGSMTENISSGNREMANYIRKIMGIESLDNNIQNNTATQYRTGDYYVVIIDSQKYPQSAEHIQSAIRMGYPAVLTLDRSGADSNRKESLANIHTIEGLDRDEYPPAAFAEGGYGAHVAHIHYSDNRGSGSSFSHQLTNVPDGARVRFRVI